MSGQARRARIGRGAGATRVPIALLLLIVAGAFCSAGAIRETRAQAEIAKEAPINWETVEAGDAITLTGRLGVYGTEPHTYLAISVADEATASGERIVRVDGKLVDELWEYQNRMVTLRGTLVRREVGPGFPAVIDAGEYELERKE